jgi:hypothetical protein
MIYKQTTSWHIGQATSAVFERHLGNSKLSNEIERMGVLCSQWPTSEM